MLHEDRFLGHGHLCVSSSLNSWPGATNSLSMLHVFGSLRLDWMVRLLGMLAVFPNC